jgi:hypothetical protein
MTVLVGTLGVLGCGDDTTNPAGSGGSGTAGTGGTAGDVCVGGDCVDGSAEKMACEVGVTACRLTPVGQEACIQATVADNCNL